MIIIGAYPKNFWIINVSGLINTVVKINIGYINIVEFKIWLKPGMFDKVSKQDTVNVKMPQISESLMLFSSLEK